MAHGKGCSRAIEVASIRVGDAAVVGLSTAAVADQNAAAPCWT